MNTARNSLLVSEIKNCEAFARSLTTDWEDVLQDVSLAILEKGEEFIWELGERGELRPYVLRCIRNRVYKNNAKMKPVYMDAHQIPCSKVSSIEDAFLFDWEKKFKKEDWYTKLIFELYIDVKVGGTVEKVCDIARLSKREVVKELKQARRILER